MEPRTHALKDGREIRIREALPTDAAGLLQHVEFMCAETEFTVWAPGEFDLTEEQEAQLMQRYLDNDSMVFMVAVIDGSIVGCLNFSSGGRKRLRHRGSFGVSVRKHEWGNGIGSILLDTLIEWARYGGLIKKINLQVLTHNERAISLYRRRGFVLEGTITKDLCVDGVYYDSHCMGLEL